MWAKFNMYMSNSFGVMRVSKVASNGSGNTRVRVFITHGAACEFC